MLVGKAVTINTTYTLPHTGMYQLKVHTPLGFSGFFISLSNLNTDSGQNFYDYLPNKLKCRNLHIAQDRILYYSPADIRDFNIRNGCPKVLQLNNYYILAYTSHEV